MSDEYMQRNEIEVLFGRVNDENARQNRRLDKLEEITEKINNLAESVSKLAVVMESMQKELEKHGRRLEAIEQEPAENWKSAVKTVITVLISAVVTYFLTHGGL